MNDIEDAVIIEEEHYGVCPKDHKDYRTWVYNRIDGEMQSKIVTGPEAEKLYEDGWRMTPAAFTEDEELKQSPQFEAAADDMAQVMNFLLNIDQCDDITALKEFSTDFLQMKIGTVKKIDTLKKRINKKAKELGLFEE